VRNLFFRNPDPYPKGLFMQMGGGGGNTCFTCSATWTPPQYP
jgi:hypothetical protein